MWMHIAVLAWVVLALGCDVYDPSLVGSTDAAVDRRTTPRDVPRVDTDLMNACGGDALLEGSPGAVCGPCEVGRMACDGLNALKCDYETEELAALGEVTASATFDGFTPRDSVDGSRLTSWFSRGPETGREFSRYEWRVTLPECIVRVELYGNGENPTVLYQTNYGFGSVRFDVVNGATIAQSETRALKGTPDPDTVVNFSDGAMGDLLRLSLFDHEADDCGGFSELNVFVARTPARL